MSFLLQTLYIFCYLGSSLTVKAFEVNESIYFSKWYNFPPKVQMLMVNAMKYSQMPFIMKGHYLIDCSLESLKGVSMEKIETILVQFSLN